MAGTAVRVRSSIYYTLTRTAGTPATEGILTCRHSCYFADRCSVSVEVHHPSEYLHYYCDIKVKNLFSVQALSINIHVYNGRYGTFKLICTLSGGKPTSMYATGPSGVKDVTTHIVEVGGRDGKGNDTFSVGINFEGGKNGVVLSCMSSNIVSTLSVQSRLVGMAELLVF